MIPPVLNGSAFQPAPRKAETELTADQQRVAEKMFGICGGSPHASESEKAMRNDPHATMRRALRNVYK